MRREYELGINDLICPYCEETIDSDCYYEHEEGAEIESECEKCGKEFSYTWEIGDVHFKSFKK